MPPKKNPKTCEIVNQEKPPKKKCGRKPKVDTSQVSIPHSQLGSVIVESGSPIKYKKSAVLDLETKIELANEVVRMQFSKKSITSPPVTTSPKKGRKKQVKSTFFEKEPSEILKVTRKRLADSTTLQNVQNSPVKQPKLDLSSTLSDPQTKCDDKPTFPIQAALKPGPKRLTRGKKSQVPTAAAPESITPAKTQGLLRKKTVPAPVRRTRQSKVKSVSESQPENLSNIPTYTYKSQDLKAPPACVDSRKTSVSSISNLSWTKDISSSSSATCVTASCNDFVRIDNKLPTLMLSNIDHLLVNKVIHEKIAPPKFIEQAPSSSDDSSSSSSSDSESSQGDKSVHNFCEEKSLNLSEISPVYSCSTNPTQNVIKDDKKNLEKAAEQLIQTMTKIDMEIINWMRTDSEDVSTNFSKFKDKMFDILDREFSVITHCQRLKEVLNPPNTEGDKETPDNNTGEKEPVANTNERQKEVDFVKPTTIPSVNRKLSNYSDGGAPSVPQQKNDQRDNFNDDLPQQTDNSRVTDAHDDDDALSLFAESITGFESSRLSTSVASVAYRPEPTRKDIEEYVPKPVNTRVSSEQYSYKPSNPEEVNKSNNICEKQNADSTSIYKESNSTADDSESYEDFIDRSEMEHVHIPLKTDVAENQTQPHLYASTYDTRKLKSMYLFNEYCFFNLNSLCKSASRPGGKCRFSHMIPPVLLIKSKLQRLTEDMFINEYMAMKNWKELRRKYGLCFVEECDRRGMTRFLVEMALDFVLKAHPASQEDADLRVATIEIALLHLNSVDLSVCEDLLRYRIHFGVMLCDVFMATMSVTQNFSRFKLVFLNLTYFMVNNDRTFTLAVAGHMLERICILPFELPVAKALIEIMRFTNPSIFQNSMVRRFEKQIACDKEVFEEYTLLKNQAAFTSFLASSAKDVNEQALRPETEPAPLAPSPDTTNLDNLNKLAEDMPMDPMMQPPLTRTVGASAYTDSPYQRFDDPGRSQQEETVTINPSVWNNKSIFDKIRSQMESSSRNVMGPPLRPMRPKKQVGRVVTYSSPIVCIPYFIPPAA